MATATGTVILFHKPSATRMEVGKKGWDAGEYEPADDYVVLKPGEDYDPEKHATKPAAKK